jgi:hypothetical protein
VRMLAAQNVFLAQLAGLAMVFQQPLLVRIATLVLLQELRAAKSVKIVQKAHLQMYLA